MAKGVFITFEGGEGAGKSTQLRLLSDHLARNGHDVIRTREPGGSPAAEEIRNLLVTGRADRWSPLAETLLFYAARVEHWREVIEPALASGKTVLCDRFTDSTIAYQAYAGGLPRASIEQLHALVLPGVAPDLTLILDMPVEAGLVRAAARNGSENRFEAKGTAFHEKLRSGFLDIARREPVRCVVIDAQGTVDDVQSRIQDALRKRLKIG